MVTPHQSGHSAPASFRAALKDAIGYWEPRRIGYNLVLSAVVIAWLILTWPHFRAALTFHSLLIFLILAGLANVSYSVAYMADISMQYSSFGDAWRRWRRGLWLGGTLFAILVANYWIADEIYPWVQ